MGKAFSAYNRQELLQEMQSVEPDLLIIGGGITGAGILLDAAVRGLSCVLIDMQDFAGGTSSRSTKLIHGGLRYLKQFEVGLVAQVGKEREIVYENAPHVTRPERMLLPIYKNGTYGKFATSFGLRLYDFLAGVKKEERRQMLTIEQTLAKEPLLKIDGLQGSGCYVEYRTDDARLTLEVIKEAFDQGALALNYVKAESLIYDSGIVTGIEARDVLTGKKFSLRAKTIVNASGPWVDKLREMDGSKQGKTIHLTKGVHLVVDRSKFPLQNPVYFDVPDGRMIFAIPREGKTYIGTTDTNFHEDLSNPRMTNEDLRYLMNAVHFMFPSVALRMTDIESGWAGVRSLILEKGKAPSEISRRDELFESPSGLISITGGKLTGYRKMAEKVVDIVCRHLFVRTHSYPLCMTDRVPLSGGKFGGSIYYSLFVQEFTREGVLLGLSEETAKKLVMRYGTNIETLYDFVRQRSDEMIESGLPNELFLSLTYALECELACTPADFFVRRTGSLFFDIAWVQKWKEPVVNFMARKLSWTDEQIGDFMQELELRIMDATEPG